jgi:hypothetical protein
MITPHHAAGERLEIPATPRLSIRCSLSTYQLAFDDLTDGFIARARSEGGGTARLQRPSRLIVADRTGGCSECPPDHAMQIGARARSGLLPSVGEHDLRLGGDDTEKFFLDAYHISQNEDITPLIV